MEPTYESIKSILIEEVWTGNQVKIKIKASNQDQPIETIGIAMGNQEEMMKKMNAEIAKMMASGMAVGAASSALGNLTGVPGAGSLIGSAASHAGVGYQMDASKMMQVDLTDDLKKETVVNAFKNLMSMYVFENGQWVYKTA
ncbi:MAG: hypothetical protein A2W91_07600 [Bacteroidetes bacterium GWF2_38_335]|nr:MAG: hypothetical protein A2W91_07600 [Bacteroidetes bacterium GWF2_38_335]OFY79075.1 MAG: hypothetical protein A2281_03120 [Bacteroidetes bacterium RIFOXYA12_FULL_38_20]HBS86162.1 hypothetical protein [Bacteroidales bacterium]